MMSQYHSHDKYIASIIILGVLSIILFLGMSVALFYDRLAPTVRNPSYTPSNFTLVHGTLNTNGKGSPSSIRFDNSQAGVLTASVLGGGSVFSSDNSYRIYLPAGKIYTVTLYFTGLLSGSNSCAGDPVTFTTSGFDMTADSSCTA